MSHNYVFSYSSLNIYLKAACHVKKGKLTQHLMMKGFEGDLIREVMEELIS